MDYYKERKENNINHSLKNIYHENTKISKLLYVIGRNKCM